MVYTLGQLARLEAFSLCRTASAARIYSLSGTLCETRQRSWTDDIVR